MDKISLVALFLLLSFQSELKAEQAEATSIYPIELQSFLQRHNEYHLVTEADIEIGEEKTAFLAGGKPGGFEFSSYLITDANYDGINDVVAILVRDGLFNAVVLNGSKSGISKSHWLIRDSKKSIGGVLHDKGKHIVLSDLGCCHSPWIFAWDGASYERDLELPGHFVCVDSNTTIYSRADQQSAPNFVTSSAVGTYIIEIGKKLQDNRRWYKVRLDKNKKQMGYVISDNFTEFCE